MAKRNLSVDQFKQLMDRVSVQTRRELQDAVFSEAQRLADAMRQNVPKGRDGRNELRDSIKVEAGRHELRALVKAGGELTTRSVKGGSSATYDYAMANEFGTQKMTAQPFFWPTYRLMKKSIRARIARKAKEAISKVVKLT